MDSRLKRTRTAAGTRAQSYRIIRSAYGILLPVAASRRL